MNSYSFIIYLAVMAGITYLIRVLPLVLVKKKIQNKYVLSFLAYMPYAVLSVMIVPAVLYSTGNMTSAIAGLVVALILAYFNRSILTVAAGASATVLIAELIIRYM